MLFAGHLRGLLTGQVGSFAEGDIFVSLDSWLTETRSEMVNGGRGYLEVFFP